MKKWLQFLSASTLVLTLSTANAADKNAVVYFYNWSEYVPTSVLEEFTQETGIKVIYSSYESNESMYAKLKTHKSSYDLVVPSSYFVKKMSQEGMLQKIDTSKLTHFNNLDPALLNQSFDPHNHYSIPYIWGATAIGVNTDNIDPTTITSWADFWDPKYKNSLLMLDDARGMFFIALKKLGYSGNSQNQSELEQAYQELLKLRANILAFNSDSPANPFIEGEVDVGMIWNGSAYMARKEGTSIQFIWPKEGAMFWMDNLAIPATAQNVDGALQLIDFFLRPDIAARIANQIGYPTPNLEAKKRLPADVTHDNSLYPATDIIKQGEWLDDVGAMNEYYEQQYQRLKTTG